MAMSGLIHSIDCRAKGRIYKGVAPEIDQVEEDGQWPYPPKVGATVIVNSWGCL